MTKKKNPYKGCRVYGPYLRKDGREHVVIVKPDGKKTTVSYPKYLVELRLGKRLKHDEDVHHKDRKPLNNHRSNLEVIQHSEHSKQHALRVELIEITCVWCGSKSLKKANYLSNNSKQKKSGPFCSKSCSGLYGTSLQYGRVKKLPSQPPVPISKRKYYRID